MPDFDSGVSKKGVGRDVRNEKGADESNNSFREKGKDQESEPRSSHGEKDAKKENEKVKHVNGKEDSNRKRDRRRDEMEDRPRHRDEMDSQQCKRQHSPSVGIRSKDSK